MSKEPPYPGAKPPGDPAELRRKAAQLRQDADALRARFSGYQALVDSAEFRADVATRWRDECKEVVSNARDYADQMDHLAGMFVKAAAIQVERLATWEVRYDAWRCWQPDAMNCLPRPDGGLVA